MRYGAAGAVTAIYSAGVMGAYRQQAEPPVKPIKVAVIAAILTGLTWTAALAR